MKNQLKTIEIKFSNKITILQAIENSSFKIRYNKLLITNGRDSRSVGETMKMKIQKKKRNDGDVKYPPLLIELKNLPRCRILVVGDVKTGALAAPKATATAQKTEVKNFKKLNN
ncbi:4885_t:CDS:2 [Entrophospora sp. SA101]|nr:4885_t:CDS:2 [Entrophospora sp. SA101]